jgi:hypothetical protein
MISDALGGIPTMALASIAIGGVLGLLGLMVLAATLMDLPNRRKRKNNKGILSAEEMERESIEIDAAEKSIIEVTLTRAPSISQSSSPQDTHTSRMPSLPDQSGALSTLAPPRLT